jgi:hypothetical protein
MATALQSVAGLTVLGMTWAPNQARTLRAFHATTVDSSTFLPEGTQVNYTDPDLGLCFVGKITDYKKAYRNGEGVEYQCVDAYRTLTKTPAMIDVTGGFKDTRLSFVTGTSIRDIITKLFAGSNLGTYLPGGLNFAITDADTPAVDKGGQGFDTWLNDLLECTPGGIAWVNPNAGSPRLDITDYTLAPSVTLQVGTFAIIHPVTGELILEGGDIGKSLNRKYEKVMVQGCGYFKRYELQWLEGALVEADETNYRYTFRFYVPGTPGKRLLCRSIDADGVCRDGCLMRMQIGVDPDTILFGPTVWDFENPVFQTEPETGRLFLGVIVQRAGFILEGGPPPVSVWASFTLEEGPMISTVTSADPKLSGEGAFVEQHEEFIKYEGPNGNIDQSALLSSVANALAARYCDAADLTGNLGIHIEGLNASLTLGSPVTNFSNARVQAIDYDFVKRSMNISISTVPLREKIKSAKQEFKDATLESGNWYQPRVKVLDNCFCEGGANARDENGNPNGPGGGGPGGEKVITYDCNRNVVPWQCQDHKGAGGEFTTRRECVDRCVAPDLPWKFIPCVGCIAAQGIADGKFATKEDCLAAYPLGTDQHFLNCRWTCDRNLGCIPGKTGTFATKAICLTNCTQTGSGYGSSGQPGSTGSPRSPGSGRGFSLGCSCSGAIKGISIGPDGTVKGVSCGPVNPTSATETTDGYCYGTKQTVTLLKDVYLNGDGTWTKTFVTLTYCGDAPSETTSTESCDCGGYY